MTNLLCAVIAVLATNWTTTGWTAEEFVVNTAKGPQVSVMAQQIGVRLTNYVALIVWNGKTNEVVLESVVDSTHLLSHRSIPSAKNECYQQMPYFPSMNWARMGLNWKPLPGGIGWAVEN